jgi:hypothetical protein
MDPADLDDDRDPLVEALVQLFGGPCLHVDLPTLIRLKRAAGRPKDILALGELEAIRRAQAG